MNVPEWLRLWWTDYLFYREFRDPEPRERALLLAPPRLLVNPSLQLLFVLRMANASPRILWQLWRNFFIRLHSVDWSGPLEIGPKLDIPHPIGLMLLVGTRIGSEVRLGHNVTFAGDATDGRPVLGDRVAVYPGAVIMGGVTIGDDAIVGANVTVTRDVPPNSVATPRGIIPREAAPKVAVEE